jgi:hypothetical protein
MANYKIFISGPSDVNEFIEIARSTILEINMLTGPLGVQFEPFDWLEAATPGIGDEPQAVINEQALGYAAIVAIVGSKVGSPTKGFESGTVEEIEKAIGAVGELPFGSKSVMVFFKDSTIDLKSADLVEASKVQALRASLGPKGILFKDFKDEKKFQESLLRSFGVILAKHFSDPGKGPALPKAPLPDSVESGGNLEVEPTTSLDDDEPGLLDLNDMQTALMNESSDGLQRIASEMISLTSFMKEKTEQIDVEKNSKEKVRNTLSDISGKMVGLSIAMDAEVPSIGEKYSRATQNLRSLIDLWSSDFSVDDAENQMDGLRAALISLLSSVLEAKDGVNSYMSSVRGIPPITREINQAKRKLIASSDRYSSMLDSVISETESMLDFINAKKT